MLAFVSLNTPVVRARPRRRLGASAERGRALQPMHLDVAAVLPRAVVLGFTFMTDADEEWDPANQEHQDSQKVRLCLANSGTKSPGIKKQGLSRRCACSKLPRIIV